VRALVQFTLLLISLSLFADEDLKLWRDQDDIKVYSRSSGNGYIDIRATTSVNTTLSAFIALLHDTAHVPEWMDSVSRVTVIVVVDERSNIVHTQFQAPWPVANRDMVTFSEYSQPTPCSLVLNISDRHAALPGLAGHIRIIDVQSRWTLAVQSDGSVDIDYQAHANTSGSLPKWIANRASLRTTHQTFQALRRELAGQAYQGKMIDGIMECPLPGNPGIRDQPAQP
jgi:hypothetical protein